MPSKSRHSHRKKSFKISQRPMPATSVAAEQKGEAVQPSTGTSLPRMVATPTKAAQIVTNQYPFISVELRSIGILSAIIFVIIIALYYIL